MDIVKIGRLWCLVVEGRVTAFSEDRDDIQALYVWKRRRGA